MQISCENCYTIYDLPASKRALTGCPFCEHINRPKRPLEAEPEKKLGVDPSKTMVGYVEGRLKEEGSKIQKMIQGKVPCLPADKKWFLASLEGEDKGKHFLIDKPVFVLGRKEADLIVRDPEVSRHHCVIQIYDDLIVLRDLQSANGTGLNGFVIREDCLREGDEIRLGTSVFKLSARSPP